MTSQDTAVNSGVIQRDGAIPLYYQLARELEGLIHRGDYKANDKFPTDLELSATYDVSRPTVRQAVGELVNKGLVVRERGRGTFVRPKPIVGGNSRKVIRHRRLGLVMPWGLGTFFAPLLEPIEEVAHTSGFQVVLSNHREDPEQEISRVRELLDHGVDGVLWMCPSRGSNPALARQLVERVPVVVAVDRAAPEAGRRLNLVESDNVGGMKRVVEHLVASGRRKIAMVRESLLVGSTQERYEGYRRGLTEQGIEPDDDWVFASRKSFMDNGAVCAERILQSGIAFDAVCCHSDHTAVGVIHKLTEKGIRVPQDMAVTGFNDDPISLAVKPHLTTVRQNIALMGERAARLLVEQLEQLDAGEVVTPTHITIPVNLVRRQSA